MTSRYGAVAAGLVIAIALAYLVAFRSYGINFEDEGLVLYSIQRVVDGELPYVDFVTGYTPGYFYLSAAMWRHAGDLPTLRTMLAVMHAATAGGLALLAARVAGPALAIPVPLLYVAFIPVFPGGACAFNIPYPAWFATFAWVAMVLALVRFVERRRRVSLVVAALAAAAALATKPNAGVFAIAASVGTVLLVEAPPPGRPTRHLSAALWWTLWAGILVGPWVTLGIWPGGRDAIAYLLPLTAVLVGLPTSNRTRRAGLAGDAATLLITFAGVSAPWLAFFWLRLGTDGFMRDVLLLGSGAAQLYYLGYPPFEPWALLVTAAAAALAIAGRALGAGWLSLRQIGAFGALGLVACLMAVVRVSVMPERTIWSLIWQLESAGFPLTLAAHAAGVAWFWRRCRVAGCEVPAVLLLCALFMHLQLFPRADFMHLVIVAPLTVVFASFLLARVLAWWCAGLGGGVRVGQAVSLAAVIVLVAVLVLRVSPSVAARAAEPGPPLPFAVAPVGVERSRSAVLADLSSAATRLASLVPAGNASMTFPAVDVFLFLTGTRNPSPFAYFFPGRPNHREEAEIVDDLIRAQPAGMATLNSGFSFFDDAPPYYFLLRRYARTRYALRERSGRFDVLALHNGAAPEPIGSTHADEAVAVVERLRTPALTEAIPRLLELATSDDVIVRKAAVTLLLDRLSAEPADALGAYVAAAKLDRRREVLLLRTLRDTRDARASAYLFAAASRLDARIANEALGAMFVTRAQLIASRYLWAGDEEPSAWPRGDELTATMRAVLADPGAPARATALAAHLAGLLGDEESVPALRARIGAADAATVASAAHALARLTPREAVPFLVGILGRTELELQVLAPSIVLDVAERGDAAGRDMRARLHETIATSGPARETAIWIAAALEDAAAIPALHAALGADVSAVRRAAAWALGEMPADPAIGTALARAASRDPDAIVRRLAAVGQAKQDGRTPRAALGAPRGGAL